jgi:DNA polymerase/3'-5' exonuclease PolX
MNYQDAHFIAEDLRSCIEPACEPGFAIIGGSLRRRKADVHDVEIIAVPLPGRPVPQFGNPVSALFETHLDKILYELEKSGRLVRGRGNGPRKKEYVIKTSVSGFETLNPFRVEFYLILPPAQWGVGCVIRTGPGSPDDNFSKYCVTNRAAGGGLPDGYRVRGLAVWHADQLDVKLEPRKGEEPVPMPTEQDYLNFLGLPWIEPSARHAKWVRH